MPSCDSQPHDALKFLNSLQELKQLRSQVHDAADYCQAAFLQSHHKPTVIENTMEYICKAAVTLVDHLGGISANLDSRLREADIFSEADLRINSLKQRVAVHEQFIQSDILSKLRPSVATHKHFSRYISTSAIPNQEESKREEESSGDSECNKSIKDQVKLEEDLPLLIPTNNTYITPLCKSLSLSSVDSDRSQSLVTALPVEEGLSISTERKMAAFNFQTTKKHGRRIMPWRSKNQIEILSLVRRRKEPLKLLKF